MRNVRACILTAIFVCVIPAATFRAYRSHTTWISARTAEHADRLTVSIEAARAIYTHNPACWFSPYLMTHKAMYEECTKQFEAFNGMTEKKIQRKALALTAAESYFTDSRQAENATILCISISLFCGALTAYAALGSSPRLIRKKHS